MNVIVQQSFNATKYSLKLKQSMMRYDYKVAVQSSTFCCIRYFAQDKYVI